MQRPRFQMAGARGGFGCQELPVTPLLNHVPLREQLGLKSKKAVAGLAETKSVAGLQKPAENKIHVAKPRFEELEDSEACPHCGLPVGDCGYAVEGFQGRMHGECRAQLAIRELEKSDEVRLRKDAQLKRERRSKYDLGWSIEKLPRSAKHALALGCESAGALFALVWDNDALRVVPTTSPAAAVNLEYLSLALRCRKLEGREPLFSLDPKVSEAGVKKMWQVKRFEPAWLNGTSLGEAMFQADYHLKELSMGELLQPVSGMRNALDYSDEEGLENGWFAREWFVVNKAEIGVTKERVIVAKVEMGVEARETVQSGANMVDVAITRPDHPLVRYADDFTKYFDLIAERRSAIFHLREMAKATTLAKFLLENNCNIGEEWLSLGEVGAPSAHKDIPQLWNEQRAAEIAVADGRVSTEAAGKMHGVYGGVQLSTDEMQRIPVSVGRVPTAKVTMARAPALSQRLIQARTGLAEMPLDVPGAAPGVPKGVDLNLDKFDLEASVEVEVGNLGEDFVGRSFWKNMEKMEEGAMLKEVYNHAQCDRREDKEMFVPADCAPAYVAKLKVLLKEEGEARKARESLFKAADFDVARDGATFSSWRQAATVKNAKSSRARPECDAKEMIRGIVPSLKKTVEDNTIFRIYEIGDMEVRTIAQPNAAEAVAAVFSADECSAEEEGTVAKNDVVTKAVLYVEEGRKFFAVLETAHGALVAEEGAFAENPAGLEARRARAKVLRAVECGIATVEELRSRAAGKAVAEVVNMATPACERAYALLCSDERERAAELGAADAAAWDKRTAACFAANFGELSAAQRAAATALGFKAWGKAETFDKAWAELTVEERAAAAVLGLKEGEVAAWQSRRRSDTGLWEKSLVQLTAVQQEAVEKLGMAAAWDAAAWAPAGSWSKPFAALTEEEKAAAAALGVQEWDAAFNGKKAKGLEGVWEKSWAELAAKEKANAKALGIMGAGAWDRSEAKASASRSFAQLSQKEQERLMREWVRQQGR